MMEIFSSYNFQELKYFSKTRVFSLTLKDAGGGGVDTPAAQEIGCHFSGNYSNVLKLPGFFKNYVGPRVKESF